MTSVSFLILQADAHLMFLSPTFFGREKNKMIFFGKDRDRGTINPRSEAMAIFPATNSPEKVGVCRRLGKTCTRPSRRIGGAEILRIRPETVLAAGAFTRASDTACQVSPCRRFPAQSPAALRDDFARTISIIELPAGTMAPPVRKILDINP